MDYNAHVPSVPRPTRQHAQKKSLQAPPSSHPPRTPEGGKPPPASPEVISNLITSLSVITSPAANHFEGLISPSGGSFGVTYGGGASSTNEFDEDMSLDELAACPPVIKTAKPPSGLSPLTAPKSPSRDSSAGLKSLLRTSSRPSSKGSQSQADETQSIGNLSIERGTSSPHELRRQRSHDSWGKKAGRGSRGLMYMSSKERLREESEKRASFSGSTKDGGWRDSGLLRPDPFLAETPINEEPEQSNKIFLQGGSSRKWEKSPIESSNTSTQGNNGTGPRSIPERDSSLHKTGSNAKRNSARNSRSKRNSDHEIIHEGEEYRRINNRSADPTSSKNSDPNSSNVYSSSFPGPSSHPSSSHPPRRRHHQPTSSHEYKTSKPSADMSRRVLEGTYFDTQPDDGTIGASADLEEGAPFPAVAQGRRRENSKDLRISGQLFSDPETGTSLRIKRSSSKLRGGDKKDKRSSFSSKKGGSSNPTSPLFDSYQRTSREKTLSPEPTNVAYERPRSADSVDGAVESYLCSPRLSQKIRHPQTGRVISFSEVGDSNGSAVFCCVGMGLTRYITAFYDELALTLKLRLITPDRPGVGDSEPYGDGTATPLSWPDDVYAICQALKITKFSILAHSAGAIYALATALRMPQHIRGRIHLLAPWIPPSQMHVFGNTTQPTPPANSIPTSQRILRALPTPILKAANSSFMTATSSSITSSLPKTPRRKRARQSAAGGRNTPAPRDLADEKENGPPDHMHNLLTPDATENMDRIKPSVSSRSLHEKRGAGAKSPLLSESDRALAAALDAMADKERQEIYDMRLTHAIWELATTGANPAVDLLVCLERRHTIGFRYVDITRPVIIHHGSRDTRVPVDNVRWLGKTMRRCEVRVLEGEGHGLMASAVVMGGVLMEISKEWEDWMKVTGSGKRERRGTGGRRE